MATYTNKEGFAAFKGLLKATDLNEMAANDEYLKDRLDSELIKVDDILGQIGSFDSGSVDGNAVASSYLWINLRDTIDEATLNVLCSSNGGSSSNAVISITNNSVETNLYNGAVGTISLDISEDDYPGNSMIKIIVTTTQSGAPDPPDTQSIISYAYAKIKSLL